MSKIQHESILLTRIYGSIWTAKTKTLDSFKSEISANAISEKGAFKRLMKFFESDAKPTRIEELENVKHN